jgi:glycopeptide antibiotics resistance protein
MFVPVGIVWPICFRKLDTLGKAVLAGAGFSLFIEILQLSFFDRVSDIDDLLLNSLGFLLGYGIWRLVKAVFHKVKKCGA